MGERPGVGGGRQVTGGEAVRASKRPGEREAPPETMLQPSTSISAFATSNTMPGVPGGGQGGPAGGARGAGVPKVFSVSDLFTETASPRAHTGGASAAAAAAAAAAHAAASIASAGGGQWDPSSGQAAAFSPPAGVSAPLAHHGLAHQPQQLMMPHPYAVAPAGGLAGLGGARGMPGVGMLDDHPAGARAAMVTAAQHAAQREAMKYVRTQHQAVAQIPQARGGPLAAPAASRAVPAGHAAGVDGLVGAAGAGVAGAGAGKSGPRATSGAGAPGVDADGTSSPPLAQGGEDDPAVKEKRERRMLSNRESARRSRQRKQQHLNELNSQLTELQVQNVALQHKVLHITQHMSVLQAENAKLLAERDALLAMVPQGTNGTAHAHGLSLHDAKPQQVEDVAGRREQAPASMSAAPDTEAMPTTVATPAAGTAAAKQGGPGEWQ